MVSKRSYKALTGKQTTKLKKLTKAGKSQRSIAKALGVSKQRVSTAQAKVKVGKRVISPFWKDVKEYKEKSGYSHKKATKEVMNWKKWGTKRAARVGKKWKSYEQRQADMRAIRDRFTDDELTDAITDELEEYQYGDTPK